MPTLPITLRPSTTRWLGTLAICAVFVVIGYLYRPTNALIGWLMMLFFGLGVLASLVNLYPGSTYLRLTSEGFTTATLARREFYPWTEIAQFTPIKIGLNTMVGLSYVNPAAAPPVRRTRLRLNGVEQVLPDTYGLSAEALADLLNRVRVEHSPSAAPQAN